MHRFGTPATTRVEHRYCGRKVRRILEDLSHKLYLLEFYGRDQCPTAGITPEVVKHVVIAQNAVHDLRRAWKAGK